MKTCQIEGCSKYAKGRYCVMHYTRMRKTGTFELKPGYGEKRKHPLYHLWNERKDHVAKEWEDFWRFVADVSPKPDGNYFLVRVDGAKPYGPKNFKWQAHLKRQPGETKKDWWARKWAARMANNPAIERHRSIQRRYGMTPEEWEALVKKHKGCCAICGGKETSWESKTGSRKNLAVDHCHKTGKIRGLLCWRCNSTLGKIEDSIPLLEKMILYLRKHE